MSGPSNDRIRAAASAIANARRYRRDMPSVPNILDMLPSHLRDEVLEDARVALEAADRVASQSAAAFPKAPIFEAKRREDRTIALEHAGRLDWCGVLARLNLQGPDLQMSFATEVAIRTPFAEICQGSMRYLGQAITMLCLNTGSPGETAAALLVILRAEIGETLSQIQAGAGNASMVDVKDGSFVDADPLSDLLNGAPK